MVFHRTRFRKESIVYHQESLGEREGGVTCWKCLLTYALVVQEDVLSVETIDFAACSDELFSSFFVLLFWSFHFFFGSSSCRSSTLLALATIALATLGARLLCSGLDDSLSCGGAGTSLGAKLRVGLVVGRDVFMKTFASLVHDIHLVVSGSARSADTHQVFLVDFVGDLGKFALLAAHILQDKPTNQINTSR